LLQTPGDIEVFPMSSMTPIHTTEQLKAQQARAHGGAFLSLAKVAGTADIYRMYTIAGSTPNGRQKITASATAAGAKHIRDKKTTCAVMADTSEWFVQQPLMAVTASLRRMCATQDL
jgi:hypothetical protein